MVSIAIRRFWIYVLEFLLYVLLHEFHIILWKKYWICTAFPFDLSVSYRVFPYCTLPYSNPCGLARISPLPNHALSCRVTTCGWPVLLAHMEILKPLPHKAYFTALDHIHVPKHSPQLGKEAWVQEEKHLSFIYL